MIELTVAAVDCPTPETITSETSVRDAASTLRDPATPALPVCDDGSVVGIVTESDIVALLAETDTIPSVQAIMSTPVTTVAPAAALLEAAELMREAGVKHLPVVDDDLYLGLLSAETLAPYLSRRSLDIEWTDDPLELASAENGGLTASD